MRRITLALILFVLLGPLPGSYRPQPRMKDSQIITARRAPGVIIGQRIGALTLVEAWELRSPNTRFGGISGMTLTGPRQFLMVSDGGKRLRFTLGPDGQVGTPVIADLPPLSSKLARKRFLDAEAITRDPVTGKSWIALEGIAQIWRFDAADRRSARRRNPVMFRWPANGGTESLARLPDRRFVAFSERRVKDDRHEALLFGGDPAERRTPYIRFLYDSAGQGSVTDATALPDGRVLILHRKLGLSPVFTSSLAIADPRSVTTGTVLTSRPIATIRHHSLAENYEGIAVDASEPKLSVWMVSDDNQNAWQRNMLLRFTIDAVALRPAKKAVSSPTRPS